MQARILPTRPRGINVSVPVLGHRPEDTGYQYSPRTKSVSECSNVPPRAGRLTNVHCVFLQYGSWGRCCDHNDCGRLTILLKLMKMPGRGGTRAVDSLCTLAARTPSEMKTGGGESQWTDRQPPNLGRMCVLQIRGGPCLCAKGLRKKKRANLRTYDLYPLYRR